MKIKQRGFTIVELLIVIVVIAILAAITAVAYNGIQQRAQNTKTVSAVKAYRNGLEIYRNDIGRYPTTNDTGGYFYNCLGDEYLNDRCNDDSGNFIESPTANAFLKARLGKLPMPATFPNNGGGVFYVAADTQVAGTFWTIDGKPTDYLVYVLVGSQSKCTVGPIATYTGGTSAFSATPPASGQTFGGDYPSCWIPLTP